jgi:hypothetical protein
LLGRNAVEAWEKLSCGFAGRGGRPGGVRVRQETASLAGSAEGVDEMLTGICRCNDRVILFLESKGRPWQTTEAHPLQRAISQTLRSR